MGENTWTLRPLGEWGRDRSTTGTRRSAALWVAAVGLYVCGDVVTTALGTATGGLAEANPMLALLFAEFGLGVLVALKTGALAGSFSVWRTTSVPYRDTIPLLFVLVGFGITVWNLLLISAAA